MERLLFTFTIAEGREEEYDRRHEAVWPQLQADLLAAGWRNYSIFRKGVHAYGYAECHPDIASAMAAMGPSEANARWQAWFQDVIAEITDADGNLFTVPQVWHLEGS